MTDTIRRRVSLAPNASRSRLQMPMAGIPNTCAINVAVATPTRRPVNVPGPISTATIVIASSSMPAWAHENAIAGVSVSTWR